MSNIYDGKEMVEGVFKNIVANNRELSAYLASLYRSVGWTDTNIDNSIGFTKYAGLSIPPKIHVSEEVIYGLVADKTNIDSLDALKQRVNNPQSFEDMVTKERLENLDKYYCGVLMHEVAHLAADDALVTLVMMAMSDPKSGFERAVAESMGRASKEGLSPSEARFSPEDIENIKRNIKQIIAERGDISLSENEEALVDQYIGIKATNLPLKSISSLATAHNILIDVYIENALPTVIPNDRNPDSPYHNLRSLSRDSIDAVRKVINDPNRIDPNYVLGLGLPDQGNLQNTLFNIIQPYVDGRCELDYDIRDILKNTTLDSILKEKVPKGTKLRFQSNISDPDGYDVLNELKAINKENRRISLSMKDSDPHLSYDERVERNVDAGYYTSIYNIFVKALEKEFENIDKAMQDYYAALKRIKELLREAEGIESDNGLRDRIRDIADTLPGASQMSATQIQKELNDIASKTVHPEVKERLDEASKLLEDLKYEVVMTDDPNSAHKGEMPPLPPDKVDDQRENKNNQQQDQDQQQDKNNKQEQQGLENGGNQGQEQDSPNNQNQEQDQSGSSNSGTGKAMGGEQEAQKREATAEDLDDGSRDDYKKNQGQGSQQQKEENQNQGQGSQQQEQKEQDREDKGGKSLGDRLKEALEKKREMEDSRDINEVAKDLGEHNTFADKVAEKALGDAIKENLDEIGKQLDEINSQIEKDLSNLPQNEKLDKNFINDVRNVSELSEERKRDYLRVNDDGYDYMGSNIRLDESSREAYEYIKPILHPILDQAIEEIEKNLKPTPDAQTSFYSGTVRSISDAAIETKLTGKINTNQVTKAQYFSTDIDIVLDTSGSMGSGFTFRPNDNEVVQTSMLSFSKALISAIGEKMAMFGVTLNVYTFEEEPASKAFSITYAVNPSKDSFGAKQEKQAKISAMNNFLNGLSLDGGTFQLSAVTAAIDNGLNEYILSKKNPELLPADKRAVLRQTEGKVPSKIVLLITDDETADRDPNKERVIAKILNASPLCDNFFAVRLVGNSDKNGTPLESFFEGFPISPEYGKHAAVIAKYNGLSVAENIAVAAKGIGNAIASTVNFDLTPNKIAFQDNSIDDQKIDGVKGSSQDRRDQDDGLDI